MGSLGKAFDGSTGPKLPFQRGYPQQQYDVRDGAIDRRQALPS